MCIARSTWNIRVAVAACLAAMAAGLWPSAVLAHENHAPLPTKGVTVAGNNVLLSDKAREAIGLTTAKVTHGNLHRTVEVNARVELPWNQQAMITSLVPGKIEQVLVRPGETVKAAQPLARVVSMELESLQVAMLQAVGEVDLAQRLLKQRKSLDAEGVIAGKHLLEAETNLARRTAELRIANEKLRALGIDDETLDKIRTTGQPLDAVTITSPIDGIITHADVRIGQVVKPSDHLYHVVDPSGVWIVGEVLESDVRDLKKGQTARATFTAHPDRPFLGTIEHVRLKMDRRTRTQSVVIAVDNRDALLKSGMFGRAGIDVQVAKEAVICPADAILKSRIGAYVLVERSPGKYENRKVKLGLARGEQVEVLEGVFPGNRVVVVGAYLLASLLGNEHKARKSDTQPTDEVSNTDSPREPITVADATIELPTDRQAFAGPRIEGRIRCVLVEPSQRVAAGQVLAEIDSLRLRTVQLDLLQSFAGLRLTEQSLARLEKLEEQGVTPRRRIWELQNQRDTLQRRTASLKRQLAFFGLTEEEIAQLLRTDLADENAKGSLLSAVPIRAPMAGWIVGFHVVPGQVVRAEDQLFEIHDLSKVWAKGYLFERDAGAVAVGQRAQVTFSAFPDLEPDGTVVRVAPTMEERERVLPIWVEVDNPDRLLKEGMLARVEVSAKVDVVGAKTTETTNVRPTGPRR